MITRGIPFTCLGSINNPSTISTCFGKTFYFSLLHAQSFLVTNTKLGIHLVLVEKKNLGIMQEIWIKCSDDSVKVLLTIWEKFVKDSVT